MSCKLKIGYINPAYPVVRNILNKCRDVEYVRIRPYLAMREKVGRYFPFLRPSRDESYVYEGGVTWPPFQKYDLCHFFNNISICRQGKPFLTTFEHFLPRLVNPMSDMWKRCIEAMQSDRCRRLIAFSDCARLHQNDYCEHYGIGGVAKKMTVLLPPQEMFVTEADVEHRFETRGGGLRFAFVGHNFWRKGGGEIVRALCRVRKHYPVRLFLVGDLKAKDCLNCDVRDRIDEMKRLIEDNREWIEWHTKLPNEQVMEKIKSCDVGLLPTRNDSFGFSVLEMQACGLPCITTNIWSLPEVNDENCGWLIDVPRTADRELLTERQEDLAVISQQVENQIFCIVMDIFEHPDKVVGMGLAALSRIVNERSPNAFGIRLRQIYEESL